MSTRMSRTPAGFSQVHGCYHVEDLRRRVAGCRDRLRRNRAARRMTGRAAPGADEVSAAAVEAATASVVREARREKG